MLWLLTHSVFAQRPTQGGMFSFDQSDLIETLDIENIRVHYSLSGPNQVLLEDLDQNGIPDYPELVAFTALEVLDFYALEGFKSPVSEAQMGLLEVLKRLIFILLTLEEVQMVTLALMLVIKISVLVLWS